MKVGVIGIGLIGGSIVKDLRSQLGVDITIYGHDLSLDNIKKAKELNLIDEEKGLAELAEQCDIIILSTPVNVAPTLLMQLLDYPKLIATIFDVGSIKAPICKKVEQHPKRGHFVACHPIAGTEYSGPTSAIHDLFKHKINIICEAEKSHESSLKQVERLFQRLGSTNKYLTAEKHDEHITYVSHLSHISSFGLANTVLDKKELNENIFNLAGSGFRSTVRLAKSSAAMWDPILIENNEKMLEAIDHYIDSLNKLKKLIQAQNHEGLIQQIEKANEVNKFL